MAIIIGSENGDVLPGTAEADSITANGGNDSVTAGGGNDTIDGGAGNDTLLGEGGNDLINGGADTDFIDGGAGVDTLTGGVGRDFFYVTAGDIITDSDFGSFNGTTNVVYASESYTLNAGAAVGELRTGPAITAGSAPIFGDTTATTDINLGGNEFAQFLIGNAGANILVGGRNSDPGLGDTLNGNDGDDTLVVVNPGDFVSGGNGFDTVYVSAADLEAQGQAVASYTLTGDAEVLSARDQQGTQNLILTGSATGGEKIIGNFGNNTLSGGGGGDTLIGLNGNDTYIFRSAADVIDVETGGFDTLTFGPGVATTVNLQTDAGGANKDVSIENVVLSNGVTNFTGTSTAQTITGTAAGGETLAGGGGTDILVGNGGSDTFIVDDASDVITEAAEADNDLLLFNGATGGYALAAGSDVETLAIAATGTQTRLGSAGDANGGTAGTPGFYLVGSNIVEGQRLYGAGGADTLDGNTGPDTLYGGAGDDVYRVYNQNNVVNENGFDAAGTVVAGDAGGIDTIYTSANYSLAANATVGGDFVENLVAANAQSTTGLSLTGSALNNQISGAMGNDTINGGIGADTMTGLGGNDTYTVDNAGDRVVEAVGGGTDTINFANTGGLTAYTLNAGSEVEVINLFVPGTTISSGVTSVTGNEFAQRINGSDANETLTGGGGADTLAGGAGVDTYNVSTSNTVLIDESGNSIVNYTSSTGGIAVGNNITTNSITATSPTGDVFLVGNNGVQTITGNAGNNVLNGNGGLTASGQGDTLVGGLGDDTYRVFSSNFDGSATANIGRGDLVTEFGGGGTDTVYTSTNYVLTANVENLVAADANGTGALVLIGNGDTQGNQISGNNGNNVLYGGQFGRDTLTGLGGADIFHFSEFGVNNADVIADFSSAQGDKISLDAQDFVGFGPTVDGAEFQNGTIATGTQATILYDQATGRVFYDADGAGAGAAQLFATVTPGTTLTANDFIITPAGTIPTPFA